MNDALENIGLPNITSYTPKNYQANPHNYDAIQDDNGIMYFGNLWGLLEFNGTEWRKIFLPNGISCTSLAKDANGYIYVGGRNEIGYLKEDPSGKKYYVSLRDSVPSGIGSFNEVWKTYNTPEGILFISYEALLLIPKGQKSVKLIAKNIQNAFFTDNKIIVLDQNGLSVYKKERLEIIVDRDVLKGKFINSVVSINDQLLLGSNEEGLFLFDGKNLKDWNTPLNIQFKSSGFDKVLNTGKSLIITSLLNGVIIADHKGNILLHLNKSKGLLSNTITGCFKDANGNLWITSNAGISYVPLSHQLSYLNDFSGVSGTPYSSAIYNGSLYLSTSEGLFRKTISKDAFGKDKFQRVESITGLIWNLFVFDHKLFCGQAKGAYVIDQHKVQKVFNEGTWLFHPLEDSKLLLIGTYSGLAILEKKKDLWVFRNSVRGFEESSRFIVADKYGDFWVSHGNKGVYQIRLNKKMDSVIRVKRYGKTNGLPADFDNTVFKLNKEIVISGTSGIFKYDHDREKVIPFSPLSKIIGDSAHVERIVEYTPDKFWMVYNRGNLAKIERDDKTNFKIIWETKKIKNSWIQAFEHLNPISEKNLILGTQEGFAILSISGKAQKGRSQFSCYITKVENPNPKELLYKGYSKGKVELKNALPYSKRSLRFTFTSTSYEDTQNNQYQYFLRGFEEENQWSEWSSVPFKEYTNLKEGVYSFHVRVQNSDGKVSEENIFEFTITPPWHRTVYAYAAYFLAAIFIVHFIIKKVNKHLEKEKKKIEAEKQRKLWEQQKEWEEAALKKEKLLMLLRQQKLEAEAEALHQKELLLAQEKEKEMKILEIQKEKFEADIINKNNELTSLTVHITQKNELLNKIKSSINKSAKESSDPGTFKSLSQVQALIEKGLNSSKEWEKFKEHFDNVHEGFLKRLQQDYPDLKPSSLKLCAYLKMRLSSKQISVLMNTAPDSVIKARYRLRMKFSLNKETGLEEFLNNY